jgi:4-hydroxybenzoate polyprenyltransferase
MTFIPRSINQFIAISRPRFWLYLAGPFVVGTAFSLTAKTEFFSLSFIYSLFFFLIPANFYLYGLNDYFDEDTDIYNVKKKTKEIKLEDKSRKVYTVAIIISFLCSIPLFFILNDKARIFLIIFIVLATLYSMPPVRLKARILVDFLSNILYGIPAFLAYAEYTHQWPHIIVISIILCWTSGMHLFSAIPDIIPDKQAGLKTSAVVFGKKNSLYMCAVLWGVAACIASYLDPFYVFAFIYPCIPVYILACNVKNITKIYWAFPYINGILGFIMFWYYAASLIV